MSLVRRWIGILVVLGMMLNVVGCTLNPWDGETGVVENRLAETATPTAILVIHEESLLTELYRRVNPSVVSVQVSRQAGDLAMLSGSDSESDTYRRGQGSGFIVDGPKGIVITYNHVVEDAEVIQVVLWDGTVLPAEVLGRDPNSDVAVLQVEAEGLTLQSVSLGDSDALEVGQRAIAIGNPFGWHGTLTTGIISGLGRTLRLGHTSERASSRFSIPEMIQTDAAINFGNSGGPLLDSSGRVIGINTAMNSVTGASSGVGFAVPINTVKRVLPELIEKGHYAYPWMGVTGTDLRPIHVEAMDLPVDRGAIVMTVPKGGPADVAGLQGATRTVEHYGEPIGIGGDVIVAIDGKAVHQFDDLLIHLIREKRPGDQVMLTIVRAGDRIETSLTLGERPTD